GGAFSTTDIGKIERIGGTIKIDGQFDNTGATLTLNEQTGSWLLEGGTLKGGHLITSGGATFRPRSGVWDGLTVESDVQLENGDSLVLRNGLTLNAVLSFPNG